jgi:hypothetical protein
VLDNGKEYEGGSTITPDMFDEKSLDVFLRTGLITCELKKEFAELDIEDLFKYIKLNEVVGSTFKKASELLGIDFEIVKEKFELKQGATNKKVKKEDIKLFKELIEV